MSEPTNKDLAFNVAHIAKKLNVAIREACETGLRVEISQYEVRQTRDHFPCPEVRVAIAEPLAWT